MESITSSNVVLFLCVVVICNGNTVDTVVNLTGSYHNILEGHGNGFFKVITLTHCERVCLYTAKCSSVNWNPKTKFCQLNAEEVSSETGLQLSTDDILSRTSIIQKHPCIPNPCEYMEVCIPVVVTEGYVCLRPAMAASTETRSIVPGTSSPTATTTASTNVSSATTTSPNSTTTPSSNLTTHTPSTTPTTTTTGNTTIQSTTSSASTTPATIATTTTATTQTSTSPTTTTPLTTANTSTTPFTATETTPATSLRLTSTEASKTALTSTSSATTTTSSTTTTTSSTTAPFTTATTTTSATTTSRESTSTETRPTTPTTITATATTATTQTNTSLTTTTTTTTTSRRSHSPTTTTRRTRTTTPDCSTYSNSFSKVEGRVVWLLNNKTIYDTWSVSKCEEYCVQHTRFTCRSYEYYYQEGWCFLQSFVKDDALRAWTTD